MRSSTVLSLPLPLVFRALAEGIGYFSSPCPSATLNDFDGISPIFNLSAVGGFLSKPIVNFSFSSDVEAAKTSSQKFEINPTPLALSRTARDPKKIKEFISFFVKKKKVFSLSFLILSSN
jgi:hypothetical protein